MSSNKKKKNATVNLRRYKTRREMNIGIFIFTIVFIYLVITIFMYVTDKKISVYEVREGSIVKDTSYTGLILRTESVVNADTAGYVSYFKNEGNKIKSGSNLYAVSTSPLETGTSNDSAEVALSTDEKNSIILQTQDFNESYRSEKFSSVYTLKNSVSTILSDASSQSYTTALESLIAQSGDSVSVYTSTADGILSLTVDGYESLTESSLEESLFDKNSYESTYLSNQSEVAAGDPVYKLITDENWKIYIILTDDEASDMADTTSVTTRINKDSETVSADFSIIRQNDTNYGVLSYDNSMIRYFNERLVGVELILEDETGLKIPKSAVIDKDFYIVPSEYLTSSGSSSTGVMVQNSDGDAVYQSVDVYYTSDDGYAYINTSEFKENTVIVKPESSETYTISDTQSLQGVYNINKGYAVFKQVSILCENDEYYIVEEGTSYGLSNYDHIVQDGTTVTENEVVFE